MTPMALSPLVRPPRAIAIAIDAADDDNAEVAGEDVFLKNALASVL